MECQDNGVPFWKGGARDESCTSLWSDVVRGLDRDFAPRLGAGHGDPNRRLLRLLELQRLLFVLLLPLPPCGTARRTSGSSLLLLLLLVQQRLLQQ